MVKVKVRKITRKRKTFPCFDYNYIFGATITILLEKLKAASPKDAPAISAEIEKWRLAWWGM